MSMRESLVRTWFFEGLPEADLDALLKLGRRAAHSRGEAIVVEGEPAETFHILLRGSVLIKMNAGEHGELVLSTLRETGEIFGWSALIEGGHSTATAECLENTEILSFRNRELEDLFDRNPSLGYRFMKRLASLISARLENTRTQLLKEIS